MYDSELFTYLFDLDFDTDNCQFTVDARNYGNISHFVNHSVSALKRGLCNDNCIDCNLSQANAKYGLTDV